MIMKFPGDSYAGKRIVETARLLYVFPTMLDMLRIRPESLTQGVSLMPRVQGRSTTVNPAISTGGVGSEAIVMNGWKLIHNNELEKRLVAIPLAVNNEFELYNLNVDPGEWNNLTEVRIKEREQLWQRLLAERAVNEQLSKRIHTKHKPLDAQMEEQLRSLGYLQ